ncbi:hypothetical protein CBW58_14375 [Yersinia frederiksenii]|nr:hypothetical protein CBW58_14375 [Yersinia frederiksenii]
MIESNPLYTTMMLLKCDMVRDLMIGMPGKVISYNADLQRAVVECGIQRHIGDGQFKTLPVNLKRLSASSALLAKGFTAEVFYSKFEEGCRTDNWKPLMLEIEAMALSGVAAAAMTLFLPQAVWLLSLAVPPTVAFIVVVISIAIVASWVNTEFVDKLNGVILDYINSHIMDY